MANIKNIVLNTVVTATFGVTAYMIGKYIGAKHAGEIENDSNNQFGEFMSNSIQDHQNIANAQMMSCGMF